MSEKEQFLRTWETEVATTLKVLRAYPPAKGELKPHGKSRSARDLAWTFVFEGTAGASGAAGKLEFPPKLPAPPTQWDALVSECERAFRTMGDSVRSASDADLNKTVKFFVAPKKDGRRATARLSLAPPDGHGAPPRAVLGLPAHGGRQSALDLWPHGGRALDVIEGRP